MFDHVIIGKGAAALGVLEGLKSANELQNTVIIDFTESKIEVTNTTNGKVKIGQIGNGGNSQLWHGVISFYNIIKHIEYKSVFNMFFKKFYHLNNQKIESGYSFIPFRPLRPKKIIEKEFGNIHSINKEVISFKIEQNEVVVILSGEEIRTKKLWLCTGTTGTFDLLNNSGYIATEKTFFSDHLVGYFGQIQKKDIPKTFSLKPLYSVKGHFKKFHKITLTENKSLYVNLRPALFKFKNIDIANKSRDFFADSSKSIIKKLLFKFNLALVFEALYNKFGIHFHSKLYNIVGHVEVQNSVYYSKSKKEIFHLIDKIEFSEQDQAIIQNYFNNCLTIKKEIFLSPGIHFMNAQFTFDNIDTDLIATKRDSPVIICSSLCLNITSPEHPTFSLIALSFLKSKK